MSSHQLLLVTTMIAGLGGVASAEYRDDLNRVAESVKQTPPARGIDRAPMGPPTWCPPPSGAPSEAGFHVVLESYYRSPDTRIDALIDAATRLCKNDPRQPIIQKAAAEVQQLWMNRFGLSAADAVDSMRLSIDPARIDAEKQRLCDAITLDDELGGADRAFMQARRELFDCPGSTDDKISQVAGTSPMAGLVPWLDSSAHPADPLVELAFVAFEARAYARSTDPDKALLGYAISQFDIASLDRQKVLAMAQVAPYRGNDFARVQIKETLGALKLDLMKVGDLVRARTAKDPDWKELILTSPERGRRDWLAGAANYAAALQRSTAFEQAAFGGSRRAIAGCTKILEPDLVGVLQPLAKPSVDVLIDEINKSPVAGLLFRRYQACVAADGDADAAREMIRIPGIRVIRGPRAAAYYATIDALGKIRADRARFAVSERDVPFDREDILFHLTENLAHGKGTPTAYQISTEAGMIETIKQNPDGLAITFKTDKRQVWQQTCVPTDRIIMITSNGSLIYDHKCTGKLVIADKAPAPILVPTALAARLAVGRRIAFGVSNTQDRRVSMPYVVFADGQGKNVVAFFGIGL